jgi:hypothetical protein
MARAVLPEPCPERRPADVVCDVRRVPGTLFKAWFERAIAAEVERQETERAEDERRRRRSR